MMPRCPSDYLGGPQDEPLTGELLDTMPALIDGNPVRVHFDVADLVIVCIEIAGASFEPESFSYRVTEDLQQRVNAYARRYVGYA
jgi:hypothetical protein